MCGIGGAVSAPGATAVDATLLRGMLEHLAHRGPDDSGCLQWTVGTDPVVDRAPAQPSSAVALVHRRLSILDTSTAGWQPMGDDRHFVVFNGEIYNFVELRAELQRLGHRFSSTGDTEVLLAAYSEWGTAAFQRFTGMFAVAVLDVAARTLVLARDPFGIKPLYYHTGPQGLAFCSELTPLLSFPGVSRSVEPQRLYDYLRHGAVDHDEHTLLADIAQVPPATFLEIPIEDPTRSPVVKGYWDLPSGPAADLSFAEAAGRLRDLFLDSVRLHLRSDRRVGAALSGGIDSSSIVMAMREVSGDAVDLHTITFVAEDSRINEERWSDVVARAAGAHVHKVQGTSAELARDVDDLLAVQELPFASTSIYAQYRVFRAARDLGITVMLDGQGADELLAGYRNYLGVRVLALVKRGRIADAVRLLRASSPGGRPWSVDVLPTTLGPLLPPAAAAVARRLVHREPVPEWLDGGWFAARGVEVGMAHRRGDLSSLQAQLHDALTRISLPALLRYEDRNAMAHSIENRVPFLTPEMATFVSSLPDDHLISPDGLTKAVFRQAMRGVVPDAILDRRDKIGFATPERTWLSQLTPWVGDVLGSEVARAIPVLRHAAVVRQWEAVASGAGRFDWRVWRWVNLVRWAERLSVDFR